MRIFASTKPTFRILAFLSVSSLIFWEKYFLTLLIYKATFYFLSHNIDYSITMGMCRLMFKLVTQLGANHVSVMLSHRRYSITSLWYFISLSNLKYHVSVIVSWRRDTLKVYKFLNFWREQHSQIIFSVFITCQEWSITSVWYYHGDVICT